MIKSLNKSDILVTPFETQKTWENNNLDPSDLILWSSGALSGPIAFTYKDYGDNSPSYPIINSFCNLALQQQDNDFILYQRGILNTSLTYPYTALNFESSSKNIDGSDMGMVYEQNKHLFYNNYDNFTKTFGMESANLEETNRILTNTMDVFTIPRMKFGQKIVPQTVEILDKSFDKIYKIIDDGKCNLIFSGSIFSTHEENTLLSSSLQNLVLTINSYDYNSSPSIELSNISSSLVSYQSYTADSAEIVAEFSGGMSPYTLNWYVGGDFRDFWKIKYTGENSIKLSYNNRFSNISQLFFENTYVVCRAIDYLNTEVFSNIIYLASGSTGYTGNAKIDTINLTTLTSTTYISPEFPTTSNILRLKNTGEEFITNNQNLLLDKNYVLYNYVPNNNIVNSISGIPSGLSPYSSSFIGLSPGLWFSTNNLDARWISPMSENNIGYGNIYTGKFVYRIYFDLVTPNNFAINPNGFTLSGSWAVDYSGSIYVNDTYTNNNLTGSSNFSGKSQFNITGGFVSGRNYLDFYVYNPIVGSGSYGVFENPCGLYVEFYKNNLLFNSYSPVYITNQSSNIVCIQGNPVTLNAVVTGDYPITYQWYKDDIAIPNATANSFSLPFMAAGDVGIYNMSASNAYGSTVTSPIQLTISVN